MRYQAIGDICLIKSRNKKLAQKILKDSPKFRTVCMQGEISGKYRRPKIEVIAGDRNTETIHREVGCAFKIDVAKIMWSKGNHQERKRMMKAVKKNEVVLDCFSGVGYWSIPIADKVRRVYAIELNPIAFKYLEKNIRLNRLTNVVAIKGDCAKEVPKLKVKADRVVMGLLPSAKKYISTALKAIKKAELFIITELQSKEKRKIYSKILKAKQSC